MRYADGYVIPVPKKSLAAYRTMAKKAGKIWREYGALEYCECSGDDLRMKMGTPFTKMAKVKPSETVVFSWIVFKSKAHRNSVNKKVMKDPRIEKMITTMPPFDFKRMAVGGFKIMVDL